MPNNVVTQRLRTHTCAFLTCDTVAPARAHQLVAPPRFPLSSEINGSSEALSLFLFHTNIPARAATPTTHAKTIKMILVTFEEGVSAGLAAAQGVRSRAANTHALSLPVALEMSVTTPGAACASADASQITESCSEAPSGQRFEEFTAEP